jgi:hypothetical protein
MEPIYITETYDCPGITLDQENNLFMISGRSLPEDVYAFYEPIISWMTGYAEQPNPETIFTFKFIYFNTASSKIILDILTLMEEMKEKGYKVLAQWHYLKDDEDMQEAGEEYSEMVDVPFELIEYQL